MTRKIMSVDAEGFLLELPPIPEDEFCVYGTVRRLSHPDVLFLDHLLTPRSTDQVYAFPEHADALERVYTETTRLAQLEPGCFYYCIGRDPDDRNIFHFFERYAGKKAFDAHNEQPIIQKLINEDKYIRGVKAKIVKPLGPPGTKSP